jgi:arylsulfatase A-like enzyme
MYSELLKLPFMVRLPCDAHARRTKAIIQFQDVLPTLLEILGLGNNAHSMHGKSFLSVLRGEAEEHRNAIITGYHEGTDRCIRDGQWSYIQRPKDEPDELYDLVKDPRERHNLIDEEPKEAKRLSSTSAALKDNGLREFKANMNWPQGVQNNLNSHSALLLTLSKVRRLSNEMSMLRE